MKFRLAASMSAIMCLSLAAPGILSAQNIDRRLYQDAENRFRAKDYDVALQKYNELLDEYPLSSYVPDSQFRRAVCLFRLDRTEDALSIFRLVESKHRSTAFLSFVPFWIGVISYNEKEYTYASENLKRYIESGESSLVGQARLFLAISENELGRTTEAISYLEAMDSTAIAEAPYAIPFLASLYVREKQYQDVLDLVAVNPLFSVSSEDRVRVHLYEAEARWHLDEKDAASAIYEELRSEPADIASVAYQRLFAYYTELGDEESLQQIVLDAEIKLSGKPDVLAEFWLRIGIETFQEQKYDLSRSYFQRIWNLRESATIDGLVPLYLAELQVIGLRPREAVTILESFIAYSDSRRELILFRLGGIYLEIDSWSDATRTLDTFLTEFPESKYFSEGAYFSAYAYYRNGEYTNSLAHIRDVLQAAKGGAFTDKLLRLQSVLYKQTGELPAAIDTLREYIPLQPGDSPARMDLIKLLFRIRSYDEVLTEVSVIENVTPFNEPESAFFLLSQYMYGLSLIANHEYASAAETLEAISAAAVRKAGLDLIYPYTLFYRGWSYYREAEYPTAENNFAEFVEVSQDHELYNRAAYLAGWCAFVEGQYSRAERYLLSAAGGEDADLNIKADFMRAKSLSGQSRFDEAAIVFENIYLENRNGSFADDAIFEYAGALSTLNKLDESVATYKSLYDGYSTSPLAEESMYKRGELLFEAARFEEAREAFYEHRISFPRGVLYDAALYWGGMASFESGEPFGAVLLWEKLIESYEESAFRADALLRTAEVYEDSGDFRKALNYYGELISVYPDEAEAIDVGSRAEKLRYLILGQGEREAELSVIIGQEHSNTQAGREAILELARIYIFKSGTKQNLAPPLLEELIVKSDDDPATAAQAQYLFGEYYYRKNDLGRAANEFLKTIAINPDDRDLAAQSIYRAAEMAKLAGNLEEAIELVRRIEKAFPSSQWVDEGKRLIEEKQ